MLVLETAYVVEAIAWVKDSARFKLQIPKDIRVDSSKLALMGHSYGGQVTMFANQTNHGQRCAVAFSPGGESWDANFLHAEQPPCRRGRGPACDLSSARAYESLATAK